MPANTKESGFEALIVKWLVEQNGYEQGASADYNREYAVDEARLLRFLETTQPEQMAKLGVRDIAGIGNNSSVRGVGGIKYAQFLDRLRGEISKRGVIDVLRNGIKIYPASLIMFYMTPSEKNPKAKVQFESNIFSVTRQLQYSNDNAKLALDITIFINGLPVITCELKNQLTNQDVEDAVYQYKNDRDPKELLFQFKRCIVHFAMDDAKVKFCTKLDGKNSWFLPFDKGYNDGAGNPPNPNGIMTDYLWKDILTKLELANIIENYTQVVGEKDNDTGKVNYKQIFPRYHQLAAVKALLEDLRRKGVGQKYLIQHSAGSGKSNSIAWLAHQLVGLEAGGANVVDTVVVVTDRINLDRQIRNTIRQFMQVANTVAWAEHSGDLRAAIAGGKKIIITTVQKFPIILNDIGTAHKNRKFAIIIDEAHSSQSGSMSAQMNMALGSEYDPGLGLDPDADIEDKINMLVEGRKMLANASYFAFTATPKNKTLEMFGAAVSQSNGAVEHYPFHNYSMKQAIQEGFILDVLRFYTPIKSYYKLIKTLEDDPQFDRKRAQKKLRRFVEGDSFPISVKSEIIVDHFHNQVIAKGKIGGQARAMVVTAGIERAIDYYHAIRRCLEARHSPYKAIVAFSGDKEYGGKNVNESSINGFPSSAIEKTFKTDPYRFLVVADKFQTGYDEPLLHTMYVDKILTDIKAVQALSRLNRAHPQKLDTFVLDFANDPEDIQKSFERYYRTTILSGETDPNKLYDLIEIMERHDVYSQYEIDSFIELYIGGGERGSLDPILDACSVIYKSLDTGDQIEFKSAAKGFARTYGFLGAILPYGNPEWEKLYIFLNLLLPKLPSPIDEDFSAGILEAIDLESYRADAMAQMAIQLEDADAEVHPVPAAGGGAAVQETFFDFLSSIIESFNDLYGNIEWKDADNVRQQIVRIPAMVSKDQTYQNAMRNADKQEARTESDRVLQSVILNIMSDNMELFKQFNDNPAFKKWLSDRVFDATYNKEGKPLVYEAQQPSTGIAVEG